MSRLPVLHGYDPRAHGADCDSCPLNGSRVVPPKLSARPEMVVLAESPGRNETVNATPLVGASGEVLDRLCSKFFQPRSRLHITNAILCRPPYNFSPADWKKALRACRPRLERELKTQPARSLVIFGGKALQSFAGKAKIMDWMGAPIRGVDGLEDFVALPTVHPALTLRKPSNTPLLTIHFARALQLSRSTLPVWQWPKIVAHEGEGPTLEALKQLRDSPSLGFDVETAGIDAMHDALLNVGLANSQIALSVTWYEATMKVRDEIFNLLGDPSIAKYAHNGQFDIVSVESNGAVVRNFAHDTMIADAVVAPQMSHKLSHVACRETHAPRWKDEFRAGSDKSGTAFWLKVDPKKRAVYNAQDASITHTLVGIQENRLRATHKGKELFDNYMSLIHVAIKMRKHGIAVDQSRFESHHKNLRERRFKASQELKRIARIAGVKDYNPNAHRSVTKLFQALGARTTRFSEKTGAPSYDENTLMQNLASPNQIVVAAARAQLRYRRWQKLLRTYVEGLPVRNGRVHATWNPTGTYTGRWSSSDPSMQVIPKPVVEKDAKGRSIVVAPGLRDLFVPSPGREMFELDFSGLEVRLIALFSGDETLLSWLAAGIDVHTKTAQMIFSSNAPSKAQRELAKRARYAMHYGSTIETAWLALVVDFPLLGISEVARLFQTMKSQHQGIVAWQERQLKCAYEKDYIECALSGRRHYFHGLVEPNKCFNLPNQMGGAFLINRAVVAIDKELDWTRAAILAQVHDSLLGESTHRDADCALFKQHMEAPVTLNGATVSFPVDVKYGPSYGEMIEVK